MGIRRQSKKSFGTPVPRSARPWHKKTAGPDALPETTVYLALEAGFEPARLPLVETVKPTKSLVPFAVCRFLLSRPVSFLPCHTLATRHLSGCTRSVERAGLWTIAERFVAIAALAWVSVIGDDLHGHSATPNT